MTQEKIAKYEAWIRELESRQITLSTSRRAYGRIFVGALVVSLVGFLWGRWVGVGALLTGIMVCTFGAYVMAIRRDEYAREVKQTRREVDLLRARTRRDESDPAADR